jgi:biopolymer transport protein ExbD
MNFSTPPKGKSDASIIPMINVVFLLLIFFLMTSQISPPDPFDVDLPRTGADLHDPSGVLTIHVSKEGMLQVDDQTDDDAWLRLSNQVDAKTRLKIRVDAGLQADEFARILSRLAKEKMATIEILAMEK